MHFERSLSGPSRGQYLVQVERVLKKRKLGPDNDPSNLARNFFLQIKYAESPCFFLKTNLDQIMTPRKPKLGPDDDTTEYIYIYTEAAAVYIYICGGGLVFCLPFAFLKDKNSIF